MYQSYDYSKKTILDERQEQLYFHYLPVGNQRIPKNIHIIYLSEELYPTQELLLLKQNIEVLQGYWINRQYWQVYVWTRNPIQNEQEIEKTGAQIKFVKSLNRYDEIESSLDRFSTLNLQIFEQELYKVLILEQYGGVIIDKSLWIKKPFNDLLGTFDFIGVQGNYRDDDQFLNGGFIASKPNHIIIKRAISIMLHNINQKEKKKFSLTAKYNHFPNITNCADAADFFLEAALDLAYIKEANLESRDIIFPSNVIFGSNELSLYNGIKISNIGRFILDQRLNGIRKNCDDHIMVNLTSKNVFYKQFKKCINQKEFESKQADCIFQPMRHQFYPHLQYNTKLQQWHFNDSLLERYSEISNVDIDSSKQCTRKYKEPNMFIKPEHIPCHIHYIIFDVEDLQRVFKKVQPIQYPIIQCVWKYFVWMAGTQEIEVQQKYDDYIYSKEFRNYPITLKFKNELYQKEAIDIILSFAEKQNIKVIQTDLLKFLILKWHGGYVMDINLQFKKNFLDIPKNKQSLFLFKQCNKIGNNHFQKSFKQHFRDIYYDDHADCSITNVLMAAVPQHKIIMSALELVKIQFAITYDPSVEIVPIKFLNQVINLNKFDFIPIHQELPCQLIRKWAIISGPLNLAFHWQSKDQDLLLPLESVKFLIEDNWYFENPNLSINNCGIQQFSIQSIIENKLDAL